METKSDHACGVWVIERRHEAGAPLMIGHMLVILEDGRLFPMSREEANKRNLRLYGICNENCGPGWFPEVLAFHVTTPCQACQGTGRIISTEAL